MSSSRRRSAIMVCVLVCIALLAGHLRGRLMRQRSLVSIMKGAFGTERISLIMDGETDMTGDRMVPYSIYTNLGCGLKIPIDR